MSAVDKKIQLYNLNLFYPRSSNIETETNFLIQKKINEFISSYLKYTHTYIFILDYKDDIISAISYRMMKALSNVCDFQLVIYGKVKKTKQWIDKKEKKISTFRLNRLIKKNKAILISVFNPLYQVGKKKKFFKNFDCPIWKPIEQFTLDNLKAAQVFYHIGYIKNDIIYCNNSESFMEWILKEDNYYKYNEISSNYNGNIYLVKLTNDLSINEKILQNIENKEGIIIYEIEKLNENIVNQLKTFSFYLSNNSNTFGYNNWNNHTINIETLAAKVNGEIITYGKEDVE